TTLRSVLGKHELDEMLSERDKLNADLQEILDRQTEDWGIKVANVEIKHVDIDESMVRAIARQAEAERNRRARIINAEGEQQAAEKLVQAARVLASTPEAMQLRFLSSLYDIAGDKSSTIVFPLPIDLLRGVFDKAAARPHAGAAEASARKAQPSWPLSTAASTGESACQYCMACSSRAFSRWLCSMGTTLAADAWICGSLLLRTVC